jgi:hypothetical protein
MDLLAEFTRRQHGKVLRKYGKERTNSAGGWTFRRG